MSDEFYRAFEERYRGSRELIMSRLRVYLPFVEPLKSVYPRCTAVDLGCGRGEWLELMAEAGIEARGVDLDDGMLAACAERGLPAERGEAVAFLRALPEESVAVVSAFHVAEHIAFDELQALVQQALRVLQPAGLLILETPNPENLVVGTSNFFLDPTHLRPIPPPLLAFLPEFHGYRRVKVMRLQEAADIGLRVDVGLADVLGGVSPDYAVVAQKDAAAEVLALFADPFAASFGVDLLELAQRYEEGIGGRIAALGERLTASETKVDRMQDAIVRLTELQQRLQAMFDERAALRAEAERLSGRLGEAERARADMEQARAAALTLAEQRQQQVMALHESLSWKITAPLRAVGRVAQRPSVELAAFARGAGASAVKWAGDRVQRSPALQRLALRLLHRFPALEWRLRRIYRERATAEQAQPAPWSGAGPGGETTSAAATEVGAEIAPRGDGNGVNVHQRGPLEANFHAYRGGP